ncbi:MAG: hypothetical protein ACPG52_00830 [Cognaticolwellia sp.]
MINHKLLTGVLALALSACSQKALYQVGQDYKKSDCIQKAASPQQHNDCLNAEHKSFEEYEKERKALTKK